MTSDHHVPGLRELITSLVYTLAAVLVIGVIFVVTQTFTLLTTVRETQKDSRESVEAIRDCTQPSGECYREARERSARTVTDIGKVSAYAAACADRPGVQTEDEVRLCVLRKVARDARDTP